MLDFLGQIVDFITMLFDFVVDFITGIIDLFKLIPEVLEMMNNAVGFLPSWLLPFTAVTLTVAVIYLTLGRTHGGD